MILASKRPLWTCITDSRQTSHHVREVPHFRTHAPQQTAPLLDHLVGESYETWRTSRPETEAPNTYSASMTTCRACVRREAPNIATKPSMATSNTVSLVPTIQSII